MEDEIRLKIEALDGMIALAVEDINKSIKNKDFDFAATATVVLSQYIAQREILKDLTKNEI